jgi:hypothetical protein
MSLFRPVVRQPPVIRAGEVSQSPGLAICGVVLLLGEGIEPGGVGEALSNENWSALFLFPLFSLSCHYVTALQYLTAAHLLWQF